MTLNLSLLLGLAVVGFRLCVGSFSVLSEPREACARYQVIEDAIAELTADVESQPDTSGPMVSLQLSLRDLLSALTVHPSCETIISSSGLYRIQAGNGAPVHYYCQVGFMGGSWTVMQRRTSARTNFTRSFNEYRDGFGHASADFWLGLTRISQLTMETRYELAIVLESFDGLTEVIRYTDFKVTDWSDNFRLTTLSGYTGPNPDSMSSSVGMTFSTFDKDSDTSLATNCASIWGGGWWLSNCGDSNLNGFYRGSTPTTVAKTSMVWTAFKGASQSLKSSTMYIRKYVP